MNQSSKHKRILRFLSPTSLRWQILSRSFLILSVLLLLVGIFQYFFMRQFLYTSAAVNMRTQIRSIPPNVWQAIRSENTQEILDPSLFFHLLSPDETLAFVDRNGNVHDLLDHFGEHQAPKLPVQTYQQASKQRRHSLNLNIIKDAKGQEQLVVLQPLPNGLAQISNSVRPLQDILMRELTIYASLSLAALVVGLFTFLPVIRRTLVPLSNIVDTVEQINAGNLHERLPTEQGQVEVDRLSISFNAMLERLEASFIAEQEAKEQMRRFVADASHELRTPLTSIRGFLEVLLRGASNNSEQLKKALASMHGESERLSKLVGDLLFLAKMDRTPTLHMMEGQLDLVIHEMESQLLLLAGERSVQFSIASDVKSVFDPDKIKQVLLNLFQNAVQHTHPIDGEIRVSLQHFSPEAIILSIQDNGVGIPDEHLPHLFERFYRVDASRARKYGGAGLGLAITKSIVEMHGGSIQVASTKGSGSIFKVLLPNAESAANGKRHLS
ncbi:ATP-binding protein [Fodinisporobacter ferrooxydans]|uniref:histidine kinase n=1 Tax=Fodinisporobacter ferrooxydans TaxID=2901836 RepID=A0ABY4CDX6_9BACL|nr:ATP-binding protein [Alicyclobacillaceae bacterium MYW30-H2]